MAEHRPYKTVVTRSTRVWGTTSTGVNKQEEYTYMSRMQSALLRLRLERNKRYTYWMLRGLSFAQGGYDRGVVFCFNHAEWYGK